MMNNEDTLCLVPEVLRARGWRLYTNRGRLVDLWQYGGRAILGHNPPALLRVIKNTAERGLYAPYPHFAEERFFKALSVLLPGRCFRVYENETFMHQALQAAGFESLFWRPFLNGEALAVLQTAPVFIPVLPCPFPGAPAVLALDLQKPNDAAEKLPPSQRISPVTLAAATRCIYDLIAVPERGKIRLSKIDRVLEKNNNTWTRQGIYLFYSAYPGDDEKKYAALFRHFLEAGFLLPPVSEDPVILPGEISPGEVSKLAALLA